MDKITYQKTYDTTGAFVAMQLWQGNNHISISLGDTTLDVVKDSPKWANIKPIVDKFQQEVKEAADKDVQKFVINPEEEDK